MEAEDPLSELADIHLPDAVGFWPPAPGWWVLAALAILALVLLYRRQLARLFLRRRLGSALRELDEAYRAFDTGSDRNADGLTMLHSFNAILKRVALVHFSEPELPRLSGRAWLRFLDEKSGGSEFTTGAGQALGDGIYRPTFDADAAALHALCRRWIEQCYLQPQPQPKAKTQTEATSVAQPDLPNEARPS
ncbi:MAG: DUF4381 domain-containing protein [Pseudomonadota bacterium]|nr:DUF4381 domain-containing protein [Pseudomonadota bacterium]